MIDSTGTGLVTDSGNRLVTDSGNHLISSIIPTTFIKLLHNLYWADTFVNALFTSITAVTNKIYNAIYAIKNEFYFDTMVYLVPYYERIMQITPRSDQSLDDRRTVIKARWLSKGNNTLALLQNVLNQWKNGETTVEFVNGKLKITFHSIYGIPTDFQAVLDTLNIIKPAHLAFLIFYKYLLIKDIHNILTINQLQALTIDKFAGKQSVT